MRRDRRRTPAPARARRPPRAGRASAAPATVAAAAPTRSTPSARTNARVRSRSAGSGADAIDLAGHRGRPPDAARAPRCTPRSPRGDRRPPPHRPCRPPSAARAPPARPPRARSAPAPQSCSITHPLAAAAGPDRLLVRLERSRRRASARRVRVFTVPSGQSSRSAISLLRQPLAIRQHDDGPFHLGHRRQRRRDRRPAPTAASAAATGSGVRDRAPEHDDVRPQPLEARRRSSPDVPAPPERDERWAAGPGPQAGRRSGCGRSIRSQVASDASAGSNSSARFQSARNVSCTTSSAILPIAREPERNGMDAVHVPVVERREGILRSAGDGPDERGLVGVTRTALRHPYALPARPVSRRVARAGRRAAAARPSKPVVNTTSVSVENTWVVAWTCRTIVAEVLHVARPDLEDVVGLAGDVVALLDLGDRRERRREVGRDRARRLASPT